MQYCFPKQYSFSSNGAFQHSIVNQSNTLCQISRAFQSKKLSTHYILWMQNRLSTPYRPSKQKYNQHSIVYKCNTSCQQFWAYQSKRDFQCNSGFQNNTPYQCKGGCEHSGVY